MGWYKSTQVLGGVLTAAVGSLGASGTISPALAAELAVLIGSLTALLRFRPGAGKSITSGQASNPN